MGYIKSACICLVAAVGLYFLRNYMQGCTYLGTEDLSGKVAIVTGSNTGIGKETALDFVKRGAKVYFACRSETKALAAIEYIKSLTSLSSEHMIFLQLDLSSLKSVRNFAAQFKDRERRLDILVNNAGVWHMSRVVTVDGYEEMMQVNHLGHFLLTHLLMDLLITAAPSRIINVSSGGHRISSDVNIDDLMQENDDFSGSVSYGLSKTANILFTLELARRLKGTGVTSYSLHPGIVITDIGRHMPVVKYAWFQWITYPIGYFFVKDAFHGAQTQISCALDPRLAEESGLYYKDCHATQAAEHATNTDLALKLWNKSLKLAHVTNEDIQQKLQLMNK